MIKKNQGRVVHSPLNYIFQMVEQGGSPVQKYDTLTKSWVPNRAVVPYRLLPQLLIEDPDGKMAAGDYSAKLVNRSWQLTSRKGGTTQTLTAGNGYTLTETAILISRNVEPGEVLEVKFSAEYTDTRRSEVQRFTWDTVLTTEAQAMYNISLHADFPSKSYLSPFKNRKQFALTVQLKNGDSDVADEDASYQWEWREPGGETWSSDFADALWLIGGEKTKAITVEQDYIQDILLRCTAQAGDKEDTRREYVTRLKRWYGMYNEDVMFVTGKYIFPDSKLVALEGKVTNARGNIQNPEAYFDMELFFAVGEEELSHVGYGTEVIVRRPDLQTGIPSAAILVREMSAFMPVADDSGYALTDDDGFVLTAQFPTTEREV